jgi:hypothetical protein
LIHVVSGEADGFAIRSCKGSEEDSNSQRQKRFAKMVQVSLSYCQAKVAIGCGLEVVIWQLRFASRQSCQLKDVSQTLKYQVAKYNYCFSPKELLAN